jgi:hypothetical protein
LISTASFAASPRPPLPPFEVRATTLPSADSAIEKMYVTSQIIIPSELQGKLISEPDFLGVEAQAIMDLIADTSVPNSEKRIDYVRYTMGDPRIDAALIAAKLAGIPVQIVTDFNTTMNYSFKDGEKTTIDFANAKLKSPNAPGGQSLTRLMKYFKLGEDLTSQPLYNTKIVQRTPIMHEKGLLLRAGTKQTAYLGTANAAPHRRVNRILKYIDPAIVDAYREHLAALVANYAKGNETKMMPIEAPKRFTYPDGSTIELAFTNGKFNPNDRAATVVQSKTLKSFTLSEFAPTNRAVILGLAAAMTADPSITGTMVTDDKFSTTYSYGVTDVLKNIDVNAPFAPLHGMGEGISRRINASIWQHPAVDQDNNQIFQTEEDGEPLDRELWHDKSLVLRTTQLLGTVKVAYLYTGSFNLSNNVVNAENQFEFRLPETSWLIHATEYSVTQTVLQNPQYAVPVLTAVLRSSLAKTFKIGTLDIPLAEVQALATAIQTRSIPEIIRQIEGISQNSTHMSDPLNAAELKDRMTKLENFLQWSVATLPSFQNPDVTLKSMLNLSLVISDPTLTIGARVSIIKGAIWRPGMTPDQQEKFLQIANETLGFAPIPPLPPGKTPAPPISAKVNDEPKLDVAKAPQVVKPVADKAASRALPAAVTRSPRIYAPQLPLAPANDVAIFDWDNTIMILQTKIRIFKKGTTAFLDVSSGEFAKIGAQIGLAGSPYADYEFRKPSATNTDDSFLHFSHIAGTNYFRDDIEAALKTAMNTWMAPEFKNFINRLRDPQTAARTFVVSARSHSPEDFNAGLDLIRNFAKAKWGLNLVSLPLTNWVGVGSAADVPRAKGLKIIEIVKSFAGKGIAAFHFYDDDHKNTDAVSQMTLSAKVNLDVVHVIGAAKPGAATIRTCSDLFATGA